MARNYAATANVNYKVIYLVPDVCLTHVGTLKVPVPYPIMANLSASNKISKNVFIESNAAFTYASNTVSTIGAAAAIKGIKSGTINEKAEPKGKSTTFFINKQNVIRINDTFEMNNKNTLGILVQSVPIPKKHLTEGDTPNPLSKTEQDFFASLWQSIKEAKNKVLVTAIKQSDEYRIANLLNGVNIAIVSGTVITAQTAKIGS
ncbi:DUF4150 domain-containing protein [Orbaceae bacterium ac157xtp]